jgi:hypothetical protein
VEDNELASVARVAKLDWIEEAAEAEGKGTQHAKGATEGGGTGGGGDCCWGSLSPADTFDFVFGSDLLYEALHAEALPKVIKRRLAPNGRCRIVGAVRNRSMLDTLQANLKKEGLDVTEHHLDDNHGDDWYEDGYAALEITHQHN